MSKQAPAKPLRYMRAVLRNLGFHDEGKVPSSSHETWAFYYEDCLILDCERYCHGGEAGPDINLRPILKRIFLNKGQIESAKTGNFTEQDYIEHLKKRSLIQ
jgi:hypothetical protein